MSINLSREQPIPLAQACRDDIAEFIGKPISPQTAYRWVHHGVLAGDGTRVRLAAVRIGRQLTTTQSAIARFFGELTQRSGNSVNLDAESVSTNAELQGLGLVSGSQSHGK